MVPLGASSDVREVFLAALRGDGPASLEGRPVRDDDDDEGRFPTLLEDTMEAGESRLRRDGLSSSKPLEVCSRWRTAISCTLSSKRPEVLRFFADVLRVSLWRGRLKLAHSMLNV